MHVVVRKPLTAVLAILSLPFAAFGRAQPVPTDSCGVDIARFCQKASAQADELARCLNEHRDELSDPCRAALPDLSRQITHGPLQRRYLVHLPRSFDNTKRFPVVLVFHGISGSPEIMRQLTRMNEVADRDGFLVVYPEGIGKSWNAGGCCAEAAHSEADDVGFVSGLLEDLEKIYPVDSSRIYAAGLDNGGMMAYRLARELSRRITAVASVGGTMGADLPRPQRPVPVLEMDALTDRKVPFQGGTGAEGLLAGEYLSVPETIQWWIKTNYCRKKPADIVNDRFRHFDMELYRPDRNEPGAPVVFYKMQEEGPAWPNGTDVAHGWASGARVQPVNASKIIWEFFSAHSLP